MVIDAVVFDVGETLIDETREYGTWADWLGVPRHTFSAVFGAAIVLGMDYRDTFQYFRPGFRLDDERARRANAGKPETFGEDDLYPDARPCMAALHNMGIWVGVVGNQTSRAGEILRKLDLPADLIATSNDWGVSKPDQSLIAAEAERIRPVACPAARLGGVGMTVWVDSWQMQCCGEPFRLGSLVAWTLGNADTEWIDTMLGAQLQRPVDAAEEHHGGVPEDTVPTKGKVVRITAIHCRYAPQPGSGSRTLYPVPGSGVLADVESANGWTADRGDERFVGYLVQLEL